MRNIICTICGCVHRVSEKCEFWSAPCGACGRWFEWRLHPERPITLKAAGEQSDDLTNEALAIFHPVSLLTSFVKSL